MSRSPGDGSSLVETDILSRSESISKIEEVDDEASREMVDPFSICLSDETRLPKPLR